MACVCEWVQDCHVDAPIFLTSLIHPEAPNIKPAKLASLAFPAHNELGHGFSRGWCPEDAPAVVPAVEVGVLEPWNVSHDRESVWGARPHASLADVWDEARVSAGDLVEGLGGRLDALKVGVAARGEEPTLPEIVRVDVITAPDSAAVDGPVSSRVNLNVRAVSIVLPTE